DGLIDLVARLVRVSGLTSRNSSVPNRLGAGSPKRRRTKTAHGTLTLVRRVEWLSSRTASLRRVELSSPGRLLRPARAIGETPSYGATGSPSRVGECRRCRSGGRLLYRASGRNGPQRPARFRVRGGMDQSRERPGPSDPG